MSRERRGREFIQPTEGGKGLQGLLNSPTPPYAANPMLIMYPLMA